jgi:hypothetical protein
MVAMSEQHSDEKDDGESDQKRRGLFVTDAELIRRLGVPEKIARGALRALDNMGGRHSGFPQKNKLWGNRRYWPAVRQYFDAQYGVARRSAEVAPRHIPGIITAAVRRERVKDDFDLRNYKSIFDK